MYGAIIGDVAGSFYEVLEVEEKKKKSIRSYDERIKILDSNTPLFTLESSYTDDTVFTIAILDALLHDRDYARFLKEYGLEEINLGVDKYGRGRFSRTTCDWIKGLNEGISNGAGSAMRVSAIGYMFDDIAVVEKEAMLSALPTHNNKEAMDAASATAAAIFLARNKFNKSDIKGYISLKYGYKFNYDLEDLRHNNIFDGKASVVTPLALFIFFESDSFESGIRNAISIGGDTDTIAAIAGSVLEAYYGIDEELIKQVQTYLTDKQIEVLNKFNRKEKIKVYEKNNKDVK